MENQGQNQANEQRPNQSYPEGYQYQADYSLYFQPYQGNIFTFIPTYQSFIFNQNTLA
jgi:hypothetical protein